MKAGAVWLAWAVGITCWATGEASAAPSTGGTPPTPPKARFGRPGKPPPVDKQTAELERRLRAALGGERHVIALPRVRRTIPTAYTLGHHRAVGHLAYLFSHASGRRLRVIDHGGQYGLGDRVDLGYWLRDLQARGRDRRNRLDADAWGIRVKYALRKRARSAVAVSVGFRRADGVARRTATTESFRLDTRVKTWIGQLHWSRSGRGRATVHALVVLAQTQDERSDLDMTTVGIGAGLDYRLGSRAVLEANAAFFHDEGDVTTGNEAMVSGFAVLEPTRGLFITGGAAVDINGTPLAGLPLSDAAALRVAFDKPIVRRYANRTVGYGVLQVAYRRRW
ncbi:MAG: hypothetical protein ACE5O2_07350 [Armatimonadota bacterium]